MTFNPSDLVAAELRKDLAGRHILLLTDFDGTLAELAPTPAEARMTPEVHAQLEQVSALSNVTLGVVSGRRLADVHARVGDRPQFVGGLHGLEIVGPSEQYVHPSLEMLAPIVRDLVRAVEQELAWCPGVLIEDKTFSLTCHVRQASPEQAARALDTFSMLAEPQIERGLLRLLPGSKAYELVPAVDWHKGRAVEWIRARVEERRREATAVIFLGDDRTDEDAFAALGPDDFAIGVGPRPHTHLIRWRLAGPASVGRFFARLSAAPIH